MLSSGKDSEIERHRVNRLQKGHDLKAKYKPKKSLEKTSESQSQHDLDIPVWLSAHWSPLLSE
ncbi:hypothetical protein S7335_2721 [Synechococcus sp. PCC 7335]|nr:hypothetical protein S7335_2721 [Synechococcus sp. PCC 7335]